jgi:lipid II:glycine glycyltransferase (peptidoglycan interpeptide bridge formation enzyme)
MIKTEFKRLMFKVAEIWFSDRVYDIEGYSHVMFRRCQPHEKCSGFECKEEVTSVIDLTQDLDSIWNNMSKDACRHAIKRAEKAGIVIKRNHNFDEFYNLYENHLKHKKYLVLKEDKQTLEKLGSLFTAEFEGEILCGRIYMEDQDHMLSHRSAIKIVDNDKALKTLIGNANKLIHWDAMKYAKEKGIREFDLGGLWTDSINAFKESFGGERVTSYSYWKDYDIRYKLASQMGRQFYRVQHLH